jgi:chromosome segregation ATPase
LVAGTDADRQAASKAVDDSLRIRSVRGAEIESKIVELQKELNRLDDDVARAERRVNEMNAAKEQCRSVLPDDLTKLISKRRAAVKAELFPKIAEIEIALNEARAMLAVDGRDSNRVSLLPPKFWANDPISRKPILKPAFHAYQHECMLRIPELEQQLEVAQRELDEALAGFDESLDCLCL